MQLEETFSAHPHQLVLPGTSQMALLSASHWELIASFSLNKEAVAYHCNIISLVRSWLVIMGYGHVDSITTAMEPFLSAFTKEEVRTITVCYLEQINNRHVHTYVRNL